jgi:hypothetical protein
MRLRSQAAVLVLAFTLSAPESLSHAWSFLTSLWGAASACDEGPGMDPLGCQVKPTTDAGHGADPLG